MIQSYWPILVFFCKVNKDSGTDTNVPPSRLIPTSEYTACKAYSKIISRKNISLGRRGT